MICSFISLPVLAQSPDGADEPGKRVLLRQGSVLRIKQRDGSYKIKVLDSTWWALPRYQVSNIVAQIKSCNALEESLEHCENAKEALAKIPKAQPSFWKTPFGKSIVIGGVTVTITAAFIGGIVLGTKIGK